MSIAHRMTDFTSFIVMDVLEAALELERQGANVIHLEVGEPNFDPPEPVVRAMQEALASGQTHYTHSMGLSPLREAVSRYYLRQYGVEVSPERICITTGTSAAFLMLFGTLLNPGDGVAMSDPGYPCYPNFVRFVSGRPVQIPITEEDGFQLTPQALESHPLEGTRLFVISSPANPTGTVTKKETFQWILDRGYTLVSDEIYHHLDYSGDKEFTALQLSGEAIIVDGFSKRYAMTGCRLGWMVVPPRLVRVINKAAQNLYISPPSISQYGGLAALDECDLHVEQMRRDYAQRHRVLIDGLRLLGFTITFEPQGAFYVFADVSRFCDDSYEFAMKMLHEAHVAATPGTDFGTFRTNRYVRFAYTREVPQIEEAVERLSRWLKDGPKSCSTP